LKPIKLPSDLNERLFSDTFYDDEFVQELDEFVEGQSYLETVSLPMGGGAVDPHYIDFDKISVIIGKDYETGKLITVGDEVRKSSACGKTALKFEGITTKRQFYKFIYCYRWLCEKCGSNGGRIHKKRLNRLFIRLAKQFALFNDRAETCEAEKGKLKIEGDEVFDLRQTVYTVPKGLRKYFLSREAMGALNRMCERINNKVFGGIASLRYFHAFGDKNKGVFNPHVNIHNFVVSKQELKLSPERLQDLKYRYRSALRAYMLQVHEKRFSEGFWEKIDVHYSFVQGDKEYERKQWNEKTRAFEKVKIPGINLIFHRIKYMSRPCPGYGHFDSIKQDKKLLKIFVLEMKGFRYISGCGTWGIIDGDRKEEIKEMRSLAGEPLKLCRDNDGHIVYTDRVTFDLLYLEKDYEELCDGFYVINPVEKKEKVKKRKSGKKIFIDKEV
jgi:hypothetical protein